MSGDSEDELGSAGKTPAPNTAEPTAGHEPAYHPRPFRSWASAREEAKEPSLWSRMRHGIAGLFSRRQDDSVRETAAEFSLDSEPDAAGDHEDGLELEQRAELDVDASAQEPRDPDVEWLDLGGATQAEPDAAPEVPFLPETAAEAETPAFAESPAEESAAVAPPEDFKFPWTRSDELPTPAEAVALPEPEIAPETVHQTDFFGMPAQALPEIVPEPKRPGFFARLFGRKKRGSAESAERVSDEQLVMAEIATDEVAMEEPVADAIRLDEPVVEDEEIVRTNEYPLVEEAPAFDEGEGFASVEEALPAAPDPFAEEAVVQVDHEPPVEQKGGFFSRLLGRRPKTASRPSLEIEIHEDRIEAAAQALDDVGEQTFADAQEEPVAPTDAFESVDEALPEGDERFGPRALESVDFEEKRATIEVEQSQDIDIRDTRGTRDTREVVQQSRDTLEVAQDSRSTMELAPPPDFGDTLEVVEPEPAPAFDETLEIEEKTDEFEVVVAGTEGRTEDVEEDTAEVGKKSFLDRLLFWRKSKAAKVVEGPAVVEGNPVFLFAKFRAFYNEIIRFKHQKSEFTAGFATAIVTEYNADQSPDAAAEALSKKLMEMLELQAAEAKWMGGEASERYPDAQYAMAVLADETFTHMEWEGQAAWHKHLLEVKLYRTRAADIELFRRIDKLLKEQPDTPVARDMARVYLLVIAAGFRGKYRPFGLTRALAEYRQRLYEYIHQDDALMLYASERKIFPEAASRTLEGHAVSRFTAAQRWAAILIFLVVGYTVVAHLAWNRVSADLKDVTERIKSGNTTTGAR